ncbi:MAG: SDR family oxidoreductase [Clostridiales Family XIII bacterium]|jgi:3-oxoacyl-[acyl-carrier protein] reductase|nr:SDR family oxidoreductase [Clostridiales Family XIII bacterium]
MKSVFVTGGSGALGSAIIRKMTAFGWKVAFCYHRSEDKAKALAAETDAFALQANLEDEASVTHMAGELEAEFGVPDALVNNAGKTDVLPFALLEAEDWDAAMSVNLKTLFLTTHALIRGMIRRRSGTIVNISSIAGQRILGVPVTYATSKSGVVGFTLGLAREVAAYGIRVNAIAPGMLDGGVSANVPEQERNEYLRYCLAGRPGRCEEVADLVEFLCSDRASYVNAQLIHINGGI